MTVRPSFFFSVPEMKPRTECACQPVAAIMSSRVAPLERESSATRASAFLPFGGKEALAVPAGFFVRRFGSAASLFWTDSVMFIPIGGGIAALTEAPRISRRRGIRALFCGAPAFALTLPSKLKSSHLEQGPELFRLALSGASSKVIRLLREAGAGHGNPLQSNSVDHRPGGMRVCPAGNGKGACALCFARVSNIRLRPSPREDIGATNEPKAKALLGEGVLMAGSDAEAGAECAARYADAAAGARLRTHSSSLIARMLEYQLVGTIGAELLARGQTFEVLKSDVDADGYDLVIVASGIVRHIQLKAKVQGGKAQKVTCHTRLAAKPSGCIVAITYDPASYQPIEYACFGGAPGEPLPDIGSSIAKRSTHNGAGERPLRREHRNIRLSEFRRIGSTPQLVDWLFCPTASSLLDGHPLPMSLVSEEDWFVFATTINLTDGTALVALCRKDEPASKTTLIIDLIGRRWSISSDLEGDPQVQAVLSKAAERLSLSLDPDLLGKEHP